MTNALAWTGHTGQVVGPSGPEGTEEMLAKGWPTVAIRLRVRLDPVSADQLSVAPVLKTGAIEVRMRGPLDARK